MTDRLLGELIGLARATEGNEHLISPSSTAVVVECLVAARGTLTAGELEVLFQRVEAEKRKMVPDCFNCAAPCGKNNAYDLRLLEKEEPARQGLKRQLLQAVQLLAVWNPPEAEGIYYQALIAIGIEGIDLEILESILQKIQALQKK